MRTLAFASLLFLSLLSAPSLAAPGPTATLKQINGELDKLLHLKPDAGSPAEKKQKDDIKALAGRLIDYDELAKQSLATHWTKLTRPQQAEFVATLRELIERNYVKQLGNNLQVSYRNEQLDGDAATVTTSVKLKTQGKSTDAEIVYKLRKVVPERWVVWDVITDESSLVRNYRAQFGKIISEKSYDELIKKMKTKLAEAP